MGVENRRYTRFKLPVTVELAANGSMQQCMIEDLGAGGCRLGVTFPLQPGSFVRVRLRSDRIADEPTGMATVAWATKQPPYQVGLAFAEDLGAKAVRFIHALAGPVRLTTKG